MAWRVKWTEFAWTDLESAAAYIAKDSPYYAAALIREVRDAARSLAAMARRGRVVPEFNDLTIRELLIGNYRLIYKISNHDLFIIGFIHGARDLLGAAETRKQISLEKNQRG